MAFRFRFLLAIYFIALTACAHAGETIKLLIVDGYSNHDWQLTTKCVRAILEKTGKFDVAVSTVPTSDSEKLAAWEPHFKNYDVVMQTCNDLGGKGPRWPLNVERELEEFIGGGGGLYIYHAGNNAFENWPEYNKMIGLGWRKKEFGPAIVIGDDGTIQRIPAGEGANTSHGKRIDALLTRLADDPIHQGLPHQFMAADLEVYSYARGPAENLTVLTYARNATVKLNFPIEWTVQYGKGRVYNATYGHVWLKDGVQPSVRCAAFQTIMPRALEWLAGREVDATVPPDFPTAQKISLRPSPLEAEASTPENANSK